MGLSPLVLLATGWAGKLLLRQWWLTRSSPNTSHRHLLLSTASGVMLGVGFPDILPVPFLLWVAWIPLLVLAQEWLQTPDARKRTLLFHVFNAALWWNIVATYWVMNTSFAAGLFANIANSLLMCLPWLLFIFTARRLPHLKWAALVAFWLVFEYIHLNWELTWPWLTLGNGWAEYPL
ncbi:MAG: hypothetical protein R2795_06375 [Saprospiraceae bacterium]